MHPPPRHRFPRQMLELLRAAIFDLAPSCIGTGSRFESATIVAAVAVIVLVFLFIANGFANLQLWSEYDRAIQVRPCPARQFVRLSRFC